MIILRKRRKPPSTVPSVRNTAEPRLPAILGIVGSTRKTELSRKGYRNLKVGLTKDPTAILSKLFQKLSRKWISNWINLRKSLVIWRNKVAMIQVKAPTTLEVLG